MHTKTAMAAALLVVGFAAHGQMPAPLLVKEGRTAGVPAFIAPSGAKVLDVLKGKGDMTVVTAVKDGKPIVFYTSPDGAVTFVGVMFDSATGQNLSEAIVERSQQLAGVNKPAPAPAVAGVADAAGATAPAAGRGPVAQHLFSDEVAGVMEGKGNAAGTTYVFLDPRCPYCHNLFNNTRTVARQGAAIKWIPVNTLGEAGVPLSAEVLRKGMPAMQPLSSGTLQGVDPTVMERERIKANTTLLQAIVRQVGKEPATPTIVFQAPNGKFSVIQDDGSDKQAFAAAFRSGAQ